MNVIIVGAGIAGLSLSVRLALQGHTVTVFEAAPGPGGKLSELRNGGYRFDRGPSLFTMPQYVNALFELAGKKPEAHFQYKQLECLCHYFYEDGSRFRSFAGREQMRNELQNVLQTDPDAFFSYLEKSQKIYDLIGSLFMEQSLDAGNFMNGKTLRALLHLPVYGLNSTMHDAHENMFRDKRLVQYFDRYATYNGSDPYQAPAMLRIIPHIEHGIGAFFPLKGMYAITESIYNLALELGVKFQFSTAVDEILVNGKRTTGVRCGTVTYPADVVVSNMDITPTYRKLLPHIPHPEKLLRQEKSSSALVFYWGIKHPFPELGLHNIFFAADYKAEFAAIFRDKKLYSDPTVYINITSKENPDDAPAGSENWFVMINVPRYEGQNQEEEKNKARAFILEKLRKHLHTDPEPFIETEDCWTPQGIEALTSSAGGSLYGNSSNSKYAAFLRHHNQSKSIPNLYFCGGSVHPGGGIPLCLLSAQITAGLIEKNASY